MPPKPDLRARAARRNGQRGGRPAGEPTRLIRIYTSDAPAIAAHGRTTAEAVRTLLRRPVI